MLASEENTMKNMETANGFRDRDGVSITYDITGISESKDYPYVSDLPSLKAAVSLAKRYPHVDRDASATRITRRYSRLAPPGSDFHHSGGRTHTWRVFPDGTLELLTLYNWPFKRG